MNSEERHCRKALEGIGLSVLDRGWPDFLIHCPDRGLAALELKVGFAPVTLWQAALFDRLREAMPVAVIRVDRPDFWKRNNPCVRGLKDLIYDGVFSAKPRPDRYIPRLVRRLADDVHIDPVEFMRVVEGYSFDPTTQYRWLQAQETTP